jgi:hydroxyacylglutathione hydrolase
MTAITQIRLGRTNCYLLRGTGSAVLVDAGMPGAVRRFARTLARLGTQPSEVRHLVLTHGHADHVGCASAVRAMTGASVIMHAHDAPLVERGGSTLPPGATSWGRVLRLLLRPLSAAMRYTGFVPDVTINAAMSLGPFGIPAHVVHTPGHTAGSVSVLLDSGEALVGDLAMNGFPMRAGPGMPAFAENVDQVYASWEKVLTAGATTIYPAHGKPFPADRLRDILRRRTS